MRTQLPKIYPITDTSISGLSHAAQVTQLLAGGATFIQLREKRAAPRAFLADAAEALRIAHADGAKLIINDRVDIARVLNADGVHLGQSDLPVPTARRLLGDQALIGFSTHNLDQVQAALELPIDYLALGPIYPTNSKHRPDPVVGLEDLAAARLIAGDLPLVAIGGINASNLRETLHAGAMSAAVISSVLTPASEIAKNLRNLTHWAERSD